MRSVSKVSRSLLSSRKPTHGKSVRSLTSIYSNDASDSALFLVRPLAVEQRTSLLSSASNTHSLLYLAAETRIPGSLVRSLITLSLLLSFIADFSSRFLFRRSYPRSSPHLRQRHWKRRHLALPELHHQVKVPVPCRNSSRSQRLVLEAST